ncbi:GNAT family N-acetyltransferase [Alteromonas aestuariivivens]|uniref:GNAT family N-acetyltransferase n=1 Tax=Alteromonas aestuariivivens TaxID=1938339 RepID=A0A3D8M5W2_9ALTE|nr:GNAT family N-acetyltransferase [Alteromonas aestuariivivens]RDV25046.1 GNAT family N-acetyltransferase [Alteromonas aestuariivivens]
MIAVEPNKNGVIIRGYQVELIPLSSQHLGLLRKWRNSARVRLNMINSGQISEEQHQTWFDGLKSDPSQQHWVAYYKGIPFGATNLKAFAGKEIGSSAVLEPGLYVGHPKYQNNLIAFAPTLALYDYVFDLLKIRELQANVKSSNQAALNYNQKLGYKVVKRADLVTLSLLKTDYSNETKMIKGLLSR